MTDDVQFPDDFPEEVNGAERGVEDKQELRWKEGRDPKPYVWYDGDDESIELYHDTSEDEYGLNQWDGDSVSRKKFDTAGELREALHEVTADNEGDV